MTPDITIIEDGISRLVEEIPDLAANATSAMNAIKASWERAKLPEKRLSNAARHSISIYVTGFVAAAYAKGADSDSSLMTMGRLLRHAVDIDATPTDRHVPQKGYVPPEGWSGPDGGPWKKDYKGLPLTLSYSPHMPGGWWAILIGNVPCLFGDAPEEAEEKTLHLIDSIEGAKRRSTNAARKPLQA